MQVTISFNPHDPESVNAAIEACKHFVGGKKPSAVDWAKVAKAAPAPVPTPAPPPKEPAPAPNPAAAPASEAAAPTYDAVKQRVVALSSKKGRDAAIALLTSFGVDHGSKLKPEQYAEFIAKADEQLVA